MSEEKYTSLTTLKREIHAVDTDDPDVREQLNDIAARIDQYIDESTETTEEEHQGLLERLAEVEAGLEGRFPGLFSSLRTAARILSNAGV